MEFEKIIHELVNEHTALVSENQHLNQQIQYLQNTQTKDEQISELQNTIAQLEKALCNGFFMSENESNSVDAWRAQHDATVHNNPNEYHGVIGGGYTYNFYPTSIGTFGECICSICLRQAIKVKGIEYREELKALNGIYEFANP